MNTIEYRVRSGDTLSVIARRHNVTVEELSRLNGLSDVNRIWAGQALRIPREGTAPAAPPPAQPTTYRVRAGDTLAGIARQHHVTVDALVKANGLSDPNRIGIGQVLKLPEQGEPAPQRAPASGPQAPKKPAPPSPKPAASPAPVRQEQKKPAPAGGGVPREVLDHLALREGRLEDHQKVYMDTRGFLTAGMGHKLTKSELAQYKEGDTVPLSVLQGWAQADAQKAYDAAVAQAKKAAVSNQGFINALTSVNFQLGTAWYTEHLKTWGYIQAHKWEEAATEAASSRWYKQTPVRVKDFQAALRALNGGSAPSPAPSAPGKPAQGPDLRALARDVHAAMEGMGTDEEKVYTCLAKLNHNATLISQFKNVYKNLYRVELVEDIKSNFSNTVVFGNELDKALSYLQPRSGPAPKQPAPPAPEKKDPKGGPTTKQKSGAAWVSYFPTSTSTDDLDEPFKSDVEKFIAAMKEAGATVRISATYRPPERAYLMHWSYKIVRNKTAPKDIPAMTGVNIDWDHGSEKANIAAAREMTSGYGVNTEKKVAPSLTSNHTRKKAIDMTISWSGTLSIKNAKGDTVTIKTTPRSGINSELIAVGKSYKVIHFSPASDDPPHWSPNGR